MNPEFEKYLLEVTQANSYEEIEVIQSLWSGYGKISRYQLYGSNCNTVVVKDISLGKMNNHPRGWNTNYSHQRKIKSYKVETHWYEQWNHLCNADCRVPKFLGSFSQGSDQWIVLEDLDLNFPVRKDILKFSEVKVCLQWLANFHAAFINTEPTGLWKIGTYWHLDTRPDEYDKIENKKLKANAHRIDEQLNQCRFKTIVHGDAKLANFCFSEDGLSVAALDFQYVGGGCGIKDVAYFLGSCLKSDELQELEKPLLNAYFSELRKACGPSFVNYAAMEKEWRDLYPLACVDFVRFLLGWMPTHQKVNEYNLNLMEAVLSDF